MPGGEDEPAFAGRMVADVDELARGREGRLLKQQVEPMRDALAGDGVTRAGRGGDRGGVEVGHGGEQLARVGEVGRRALALPADAARKREARVGGNGGRLMLDLGDWVGREKSGVVEEVEAVLVAGCLLMLKRETDRQKDNQLAAIT